jgi:hypothetical protein
MTPEQTETPPFRLTARLFTPDRVTVEVADVPLPPPATAGKIRVAIPYPASEPARIVSRVVVINESTGGVARASVWPRVVEPGDMLTVEFGADNVFGFPGFSPDRPDQVLAPERTFTGLEDERLVSAITANLASLNEIIAEMTAKVSGDPEFIAMVRRTLRDHSHALGFKFEGD